MSQRRGMEAGRLPQHPDPPPWYCQWSRCRSILSQRRGVTLFGCLWNSCPTAVAWWLFAIRKLSRRRGSSSRCCCRLSRRRGIGAGRSRIMSRRRGSNPGRVSELCPVAVLSISACPRILTRCRGVKSGCLWNSVLSPWLGGLFAFCKLSYSRGSILPLLAASMSYRRSILHQTQASACPKAVEPPPPLASERSFPTAVAIENVRN